MSMRARTALLFIVVLMALVVGPGRGAAQVPAVGREVCIANCGSSDMPSGPVRRPRGPTPAERAAEQERREQERRERERARREEEQRQALAAARQRIGGEIIRGADLPAVGNPTGTATGRVERSRPGSLIGPSIAVSLAAPLIATRQQATPGTAIPLDRLLRAAAILATVPARTPDEFTDVLDMRAEELHFLGQQAALALEGAPLQVTIGETRATVDDSRTRQLASTVDRLAAAATRYEEATAARVEIDRQIRRVQTTVQSGAARAEQLASLVAAREDARHTELAAKTETEELIKIVVCLGNVCTGDGRP